MLLKKSNIPHYYTPTHIYNRKIGVDGLYTVHKKFNLYTKHKFSWKK